MADNPRNLPILRTEATQVFCDICPKPGHCCQRFILHCTFWKDEGLEAAQQRITEGGSPFTVVGWGPETWTTPDLGLSPAREFAFVECSCPKLEPDGRCGAYLDRPGTCRKFAAGSDPLCVFSGMSGVSFDWKAEPKEEA